MRSQKPDIFEAEETCQTEEDILKSKDLKRFLHIFNKQIATTIEETIEDIKDDPNQALQAYFQLRKLKRIGSENISAIAFMNTLNMILVEKIIRQSKNTEFDREYLDFFTENARILMNRGYVPITVNFYDGNFSNPIYPTDDSNSGENDKLINEFITENTHIELRKLPPGIEYTNFVPSPDPKKILAKAETPEGLGFAAENECSHIVMSTVTYERTSGQRIIDESIKWSDTVTAQRGNISSEILEQNRQYGVALFEGIGVEKSENGTIKIFRLEDHAERMSKGGQFFDMPPIPAEIYKKMVIDCVRANEKFIPEKGKGRLYVRPNWFDKGPRLHVKNSNLQALTMTAVVIGSMESYFDKGKKIFFLPKNIFRASENGSGQTKAVGNYGPTIRPNNRAKELGMAGILYMNEKRTRIEETLASSFIRVIRRDGRIVLQTPKLSYGTILDSITRKTLLILAKEELNWIIEETDISPEEALEPKSEILGCYAVGTGAGIAPIHSIKLGNFNNESGEIENLGEEIEITKYDEVNPIGDEGKELMNVLLDSKDGALLKRKILELASVSQGTEREKLENQIATYESWLTTTY